jgi:hypothetical protein
MKEVKLSSLSPTKESNKTSTDIQNKGAYKVASMVCEIEIIPKIKAECYEREIQCEIIDAKKAERILRIQEDEIASEEDDTFESKMHRQITGTETNRRNAPHHAGVVSANR